MGGQQLLGGLRPLDGDSKVTHPDEDQVFVRMLSGDADADLPSAMAVPAIQAAPGFRFGSSCDGLAGRSGPSVHSVLGTLDKFLATVHISVQ